MSGRRRFGPGEWRAATRILFIDEKVEKVRYGGWVARKYVVNMPCR